MNLPVIFEAVTIYIRMLSILIPVYNEVVVDLVDTLRKQCAREKVTFEILCFDDGSKEKYKLQNAQIASYFGVNYTEMSQNLGRAKIRNWLAKSASFENLLFLDGDSKPFGRWFVKNYLNHVGQADIIAGGRGYSKKPPRAKSKRLHWKYGKFRESRSPAVRNKHPYLYFHSNNFLVKRNIILQQPFDEKLLTYGYEDLLLAKAIKEKGHSILHINNPVQHLGLEKSKVFLKKTKDAIQNLVFLKYSGLGLETKLERVAGRIQDLGFHEDFIKLYEVFESRVEDNLLSASPSLRYLDAFKLYYYYRIRNKWIEGQHTVKKK